MPESPTPSLESSNPGRAGDNRLLLVILVLAGITLTCLFGMRLLHSFRQMRGVQFHPPGGPGIEMIRGWMTVEYISTVYQVPQEYLFAQIGVVPEPGNEQKSLSQLNREYFRGQPALVVDAAQAAVAQYRALHGKPPVAPSPPLPSPPPLTPVPATP